MTSPRDYLQFKFQIIFPSLAFFNSTTLPYLYVHVTRTSFAFHQIPRRLIDPRPRSIQNCDWFFFCYFVHSIQHGMFCPTETGHHRVECAFTSIKSKWKSRESKNNNWREAKREHSRLSYVGSCALHWWMYCAIRLSLVPSLWCCTTSWNFRRMSGRVFCTTHWP